MDQKLKDFKQSQKQKQLELKQKQIDKARNSHAGQKFNGKKDQYRSTKKQFKPVEKKKDNMDEQTRDEKEYLGSELFVILQGIQKAINKGEIEDDTGDISNRDTAVVTAASGTARATAESKSGLRRKETNSGLGKI